MTAFIVRFVMLLTLLGNACLVQAQQGTQTFARSARPSFQLKDGVLESIDKDDHAAVPIETNRVKVAHLIHSVVPNYPSGDQSVGISIISAVIGLDGKPGSLFVKSSFKPTFDENALKAVREFRFTPAMLDGKPIPMRIKIQITFHLGF